MVHLFDKNAGSLRICYSLEPINFPKIEIESDPDDQHDNERTDIAVAPGKLGHINEIHSIYTGDEGHRHQDCGDRSQTLHNHAHPVARDREVCVHDRSEHIAQGIDCLRNTDQMVENILKVDRYFPGKYRLLTPQQTIENIAQRCDGASEEEQLFLDPKDLLQRVRLEIPKDLIFQFIHPVGNFIEQRHVIVDDRIDHEVRK